MLCFSCGSEMEPFMDKINVPNKGYIVAPVWSCPMCSNFFFLSQEEDFHEWTYKYLKIDLMMNKNDLFSDDILIDAPEDILEDAELFDEDERETIDVIS